MATNVTVIDGGVTRTIYITDPEAGVTRTVQVGIPGRPGAKGDPGASAYESAVANGFGGTEAEWLESLHGADGLPNSLTIGTVTTGPAGTLAEASITGDAPTQTLHLTIPRGADGTNGENGPGGVTSVNGQTGAVTLGAADVGAKPGDYVPDWSEVTGKPAIPDSPDDIGAATATHTHALADVTGLADALTSKVDATDPRLSDARTPTAHTHDDRYYTEAEVDTKLSAKADTSALASKADATALTAHTGNTSNPHGVTKAQVGLGNVDNTSDANKPVSAATQAALDAKADKTRAGNAQTGSTYTLTLADAGKFVTMSNAAASTLTVPPNSSVAFPVGTEVEGAQLGAGQVTIAAGAGVIINATPGLKIAAQYGTFGLRKIATDTWLAYGRLSA